MYFLLFALLVFSIDQFLKFLVLQNFVLDTSFAVINNFFYITPSLNSGAAFGILQNQRLFFIVVTFILIVYILYLMLFKKLPFSLQSSLALVLGGSLGNFFDRLKIGAVVDFLDFRFFAYRYPIFNFADVAIVVGAFLFLFFILKI